MRSARAAAVALVAAALGVVGPAAVVPAASARASGASVAKVVVEKLAANNSYAYTQLVVSVPRLSGAGVTARDAALVTGLRLVVASEKSHQGAAELGVYYKRPELGQFRVLNGDLYVLLDVANWSVLPVQWSASVKKQLSSADVAIGERWFELTSTTLKKLETKGAASLPSAVAPVIKGIGSSPAAFRAMAVRWVSELVGSLDFTETPLAGGNLVFLAQGTLESLATKLSGLASSIGKALHAAPPTLPSTSTVPKGTYSLQMSTAAAGRYISRVRIALQVVGRGSVALSVTFAHAPEPVVAPQGAKVITPSALSGMGF